MKGLPCPAKINILSGRRRHLARWLAWEKLVSSAPVSAAAGEGPAGRGGKRMP